MEAEYSSTMKTEYNFTMQTEYSFTKDTEFNGTALTPPMAGAGYEVHPLLWVTFIVCYVVVVLTTICGNVVVITAYVTNEFVRASVTNVFILNLSISDIIVGTVVMSCDCLTLALGYWPFGDTFCAMWQSIHYFAIYMSVVTVIVISIDRLWLISDVLRYKRMMTHRLAWFILLGVWVYTLLYATLYSTATEDIRSPSTRRGGAARCLVASQNGENGIASIILENLDFLVSITLLVAINASVAYKTYQKLNNPNLANSHPTLGLDDKNQTQTINNIDGLPVGENVESGAVNPAYTDDTGDVTYSEKSGDQSQKYAVGGKGIPSDRKTVRKQRAHTRRRKASSKTVDYKTVTKNLFVLTGVYVLCWLPFHILVITDTLKVLRAQEIVWEILQRLIWFNSMLNPFLYAKMNLRFRLGMLKVICFKRNFQTKINRLKSTPA